MSSASESHRLVILTPEEIEDMYGLPRFTEDDRQLYFELSAAETEAVESRTASVGAHLVLELGHEAVVERRLAERLAGARVDRELLQVAAARVSQRRLRAATQAVRGPGVTFEFRSYSARSVPNRSRSFEYDQGWAKFVLPSGAVGTVVCRSSRSGACRAAGSPASRCRPTDAGRGCASPPSTAVPPLRREALKRMPVAWSGPKRRAMSAETEAWPPLW